MASKNQTLRIAHISDLHFATPTYNPKQFFSKRWIGNLNLILWRQSEFDPQHLASLPELFKELKVDQVIISGDLTTTSLEKEFVLAADFVDQLKDAGFKVYSLPGNHDQYTREAFASQLFYQFFNAQYNLSKTAVSAFNLKNHRLVAVPLAEKWWMMLLDTAIATSLISSRGYFSPELEHNLEEALSLIPKDDNVILVNHFPFFHNDSPRKTLVRGAALREQVRRFPNIKLFLHGHTHRQCIADLRENGFPIVLDSGSAAHRKNGSWNLLDLDENRCRLQVYNWNAAAPKKWSPVKEAAFDL